MNTTLASLLIGAAKKRKAFFSFNYDDIMRVNNVRNAWKITHPNSPLMRSFYDSSLWEARKAEGPEALKKLIREGVEYTSAICVLIGTNTWSRRWVRYEIARAVVDGRGLLGVHINGLLHHRRQAKDVYGANPLEYMAVGKVQVGLLAIPAYFLFEHTAGRWVRYADHMAAVKKPAWLPDCDPGKVTPLSRAAKLHDYCAGGHADIGKWIDAAAAQAGR